MYIINECRCIILCVLIASLPLYNTYAATLEARFCGYEQTCVTNITEHVLEKDTCCRPCECDEICVEKGTCCRDKDRRLDVDISIQQECLPAAYVPNNTHVRVKFLSYYTRTKCPKDYHDITMKAKCENVKPKTIIDIRPVSSHDGAVVYKNKYCSYCHNEQRTFTWDITVHKASPPSCRRVLQQETIDIATISTKILSNCLIQFTPPTNIDFWKTFCFEDSTVTKQCNITGEWETFDRELNDLCLNQTDTGYFIFNELGNVYNNLYCSLCNSFSYGSVGNCLNIIERNPIRPLYTLLNIDKLFDQDNAEEKARQCGNGEILDTYFDKCRALHCFRNSLPFRGKCVPFLGHDIGYKLVIKLVPKDDLWQTELTETDFRNHYMHVQTKLGFKNCRLCQLYMFVEKGGTEIILQEIYIVFVFTPTSRCKIENIWSSFIAAETKLPLILNLPVNEKLVNFTVSWDEGRAIRLTHWKVVLEVEYTNYCRAVSPARGELCPKVQLLRYEVEQVKKHHPRADELIWTYMKDVNGSSFVCCNNYISYERSLCSLDYYSCFSLTFSLILWSLFR